jgi:hypothetical protein
MHEVLATTFYRAGRRRILILNRPVFRLCSLVKLNRGITGLAKEVSIRSLAFEKLHLRPEHHTLLNIASKDGNTSTE